MEARPNLIVFIKQNEFTLISRNDSVPRVCLDKLQTIAVSDSAWQLGLAIRLLSNACSRPTDVEGTQGELCTRLSDRLCRENANRSTYGISRVDTRKLAPTGS